ncbi:MAG: hypothetical protein RJB38_2375 [Pseudomonadota bacterium]|jgi:hypothetical protein
MEIILKSQWVAYLWGGLNELGGGPFGIGACLLEASTLQAHEDVLGMGISPAGGQILTP